MIRLPLLSTLLCVLVASSQSSPKRLLTLDDVYQEHQITEPRNSPDGKWVAYTVDTLDKESDKRITQIWMASTAGGDELHLTFGSESESIPAWSPDGKLLSFVSLRPGKTKGSQVWAMDRRGGEARQLTQLKNFAVVSYDWLPDSKQLLLVLHEKDPSEDEDKPADKSKSPKPVAVDRYRFKEDIEGYLNTRRSHLYLFDVASGKLDQLTNADFDETDAQYSPNARQLFAASGYAVLAVNYRGSYGRGAKYGQSIWGDWGNKEVLDLRLAQGLLSFFKADRIKPPTLFMGGQDDANVPLVGGEQMYQALRTLGVPTQLIVYPGEFHEFQPAQLHPRPSGALPVLV